MELQEAIRTRRSIRRFENRKLEESLITKIIEAGTWAPSVGNSQNWYFVIIRDKKSMEKIAKLCDSSWISTAQVVLAVLSRIDRLVNDYGLEGEKYHLENVSACIQNMLLSAHDLGLGATWITSFDEKDMSYHLALPDTVIPVAVIPVGYPAEKVPTPPRQNILNKVFNERWGVGEVKSKPKLLR